MTSKSLTARRRKENIKKELHRRFGIRRQQSGSCYPAKKTFVVSMFYCTAHHDQSHQCYQSLAQAVDLDMAEKLKEWEKRKALYKQMVMKADVEGLQAVLAAQLGKVEKAKRHNKCDEYVEYKVAKTEWTKRAIEMAKLAKMLKEKKMRAEFTAIKRQVSKGQALA